MSWVIILAALVCFAAAIWLARGRRRETLRNVGIGLLLVGVLLLVIRSGMGNYIVDALAQGESVRDAVGSAWIIGTGLLAEVAWALLLCALVILVGTLLAGPSRLARRARAGMGPTLRDQPWVGWSVLAVVYLLLVLWGPVPALRSWVGVLLIGSLVALGFEAFRRLTLRELESGPAVSKTDVRDENEASAITSGPES